MCRKLQLLLIIEVFLLKICYTQNCTAPGQNPSTSVGVCGLSSFIQTTVPICGDRVIIGPCTAVPVTDKNPFWYQFTCFSPGTLRFTISPTNIDDDYDWQLFDVTGHFDANGLIKNDDVYNDLGLFVACNWSGDPGLTGTSPDGKDLKYCDGPGVPTFSSMPVLQEAHVYLLLVSHFTNSQSGYSLSFSGGTASITDPTPPHLKFAGVSCDGGKVSVSLNKEMKCGSLSSNGSEFSITPPLASVINAHGIGCNDVYSTMDSVELTLSTALPPGNYFLNIRNGSDSNTLLDKCSAPVPAERVPFTINSAVPTPIDSLGKITCAPAGLEIVMKKPIRCKSVSADGSDFQVTGSQPITITKASVDCKNEFASRILLTFSGPIQKKGSFLLKLKNGTDGNTLENECGSVTRDTSIAFNTEDTVSAAFSYKINVNCDSVYLNYFQDGNNGINKWNWQFDNLPGSNTSVQNPDHIRYYNSGVKTTVLAVSNGLCMDTVSENLVVPDKVTADFELTNTVCPGDLARVKDKSLGNINSWEWNFGNGETSTLKIPPAQKYPTSATIGLYTVTLVVKDPGGCTDTLKKPIQVVNNCYIAVPSAFTPNRDGINDYLYPLNAYKAIGLKFKVYDRWGQLMFESADWTKKWDGTYKGQNQGAGTYIWFLNYTDLETGKKFSLKGSSALIR